jgi:hypothetical protein
MDAASSSAAVTRVIGSRVLITPGRARLAAAVDIDLAVLALPKVVRFAILAAVAALCRVGVIGPDTTNIPSRYNPARNMRVMRLYNSTVMSE